MSSRIVHGSTFKFSSERINLVIADLKQNMDAEQKGLFKFRSDSVSNVLTHVEVRYCSEDSPGISFITRTTFRTSCTDPK